MTITVMSKGNEKYNVSMQIEKFSEAYQTSVYENIYGNWQRVAKSAYQTDRNKAEKAFTRYARKYIEA